MGLPGIKSPATLWSVEDTDSLLQLGKDVQTNDNITNSGNDTGTVVSGEAGVDIRDEKDLSLAEHPIFHNGAYHGEED